MELDINSIPDEIISYMALYLSLKDIINFCRINRKFNNMVCNDNFFWSQKFIVDFGPVTFRPTFNRPKVWKELYLSKSIFMDRWEVP